jgi:hypothetical protein
MVNAMILLDVQGPFPASTTFEAPADGSVMFALSGTAWTQQAGCEIGLNLVLDGYDIGSPAMCWANQSGVHQAMRVTFIPFDNLTSGSHTIEVVPAFGTTITDTNDYVQVALFY